MRVTLLGTGTSFPDPERVQSGVLLETEERTLLFDVGSGVLQRLVSSGFDITEIDAVFLSHFHIDHCSDFPTLIQSMWLAGYSKSLEVYAPPYVTEWHRGVFEVAFKYLRDKIPWELTMLEENHVLQLGNTVVSSAPTTHSDMQSRAFRAEDDGSVMVFSSDTAPCPEVISLSEGADLLIHECNWPDGEYPEGVHTTPSGLRKVVEKAQPKQTVIVHVSPEVVADAENVLKTVGRSLKSEIMMGNDGMTIEL